MPLSSSLWSATEKGGTGGGGGTQLTPLGRRVLERYRQMEADASKTVAAGIADLRRYLKPEGDDPAPARQPMRSRGRRRMDD